MRRFGSISASMWMRQQPSAPKAVAIVSFGPKVSTAQRRTVRGEAPSNCCEAAAICSAVSAGVPMSSPRPRPGRPSLTRRQAKHLYQYTKDFVKGRGGDETECDNPGQRDVLG